MKRVRDIVRDGLGVAARRLAVALSATSPRADYRAVGFPLQSLTQTRSIPKKLVVVAFLLIMVDSQAQQTISGNCDYPNQMTLDSPYAFTLRSDSSQQTVTVTAIGDKQLLYTIALERPDTLIMSGNTVERIQGTATWSGCYGGVTDDGVMHPDMWEYKSPDCLLTIALYGEYVTHIELTLVPIVGSPIPRNGYVDE